MNNILISIDFSKFSAEVISRGYALAGRLDYSVTLVSIVAKHMDYARLDTGEVLTDIARSYNVSHSTISRLN